MRLSPVIFLGLLVVAFTPNSVNSFSFFGKKTTTSTTTTTTPSPALPGNRDSQVRIQEPNPRVKSPGLDDVLISNEDFPPLSPGQPRTPGAGAGAGQGSNSAWNSPKSKPSTPDSPSDVQAKTAVASGSSEFSGNLYKTIVSENTGTASRKPNLILAPFSISSAMALLYLGANGGTAEELKTGLKFPAQLEQVTTGFSKITASFQQRDSAITLTSASRIYANSNPRLIIEDEYQAKMRQMSSLIQSLDFSRNEPAAREINEWVQSATGGKIQNFIDAGSLSADTALVLVNAIYFKGAWKMPFDPYDTRKQPFALDDKTNVQVDMMTQQGYFASKDLAELDAVALKLPYKGDRLSMVVYIPKRKTGLAALESRVQTLSPSFIKSKLTQTSRVEVHLPKFKVQSTIDLNEHFKTLGVSKIFRAGQADFSKISRSKNSLFVSSVFQKTVIEVSEQGTEAAGATGGVLMPTSIPPSIKADRPFLFQIIDESNDLILFTGRITNPLESDPADLQKPASSSAKASPISSASSTSSSGCKSPSGLPVETQVLLDLAQTPDLDLTTSLLKPVKNLQSPTDRLSAYSTLLDNVKSIFNKNSNDAGSDPNPSKLPNVLHTDLIRNVYVQLGARVYGDPGLTSSSGQVKNKLPEKVRSIFEGLNQKIRSKVKDQILVIRQYSNSYHSLQTETRDPNNEAWSFEPGLSNTGKTHFLIKNTVTNQYLGTSPKNAYSYAVSDPQTTPSPQNALRSTGQSNNAIMNNPEYQWYVQTTFDNVTGALFFYLQNELTTRYLHSKNGIVYMKDFATFNDPEEYLWSFSAVPATGVTPAAPKNSVPVVPSVPVPLSPVSSTGKSVLPKPTVPSSVKYPNPVPVATAAPPSNTRSTGPSCPQTTLNTLTGLIDTATRQAPLANKMLNQEATQIFAELAKLTTPQCQLAGYSLVVNEVNRVNKENSAVTVNNAQWVNLRDTGNSFLVRVSQTIFDPKNKDLTSLKNKLPRDIQLLMLRDRKKTLGLTSARGRAIIVDGIKGGTLTPKMTDYLREEVEDLTEDITQQVGTIQAISLVKVWTFVPGTDGYFTIVDPDQKGILGMSSGERTASGGRKLIVGDEGLSNLENFQWYIRDWPENGRIFFKFINRMTGFALQGEEYSREPSGKTLANDKKQIWQLA